MFVYDAMDRLVAEYSTQVESVENAKVAYLTNDHLGSPRIKTDKNGSVISRNDYLPYGEDLYTAQRTQTLGYSSDDIRQKFTAYERDNESGLDYAQARYYSNQHGRFTSVDPLMASARVTNPKTWNRYTYVLHNPLKYVDLDGMDVQVLDDKARENLLKTLPKEIRDKVKAQIDNDGKLKKGSLDKIKSKDQNFLDLRTMVNHKDLTEVATGTTGQLGVAFFERTVGEQREKDIQAYMKENNVSREEAEKMIGPVQGNPSDIMAYYGQTFSPNGENDTPKSPSGNLRIVVTDRTGEASRVSEETAVVAMAHELYGHGLLFRQGNKNWGGHGPIFDRIEERAINNYRLGEQRKNSPQNIKPKR